MDENSINLTLNTVRDLWSQTYNTKGKPDWSHIFPYYHPEIVFQDAIQRLEGIENLIHRFLDVQNLTFMMTEG